MAHQIADPRCSELQYPAVSDDDDAQSETTRAFSFFLVYLFSKSKMLANNQSTFSD